MVDSLRAALRFFPAVRPSIGGTNTGLCSRVPRARIHSASEQSALLALKVHPQVFNSEKALPGGAGIVRFARAVLAYVGAGLSAVTANQFAGHPVLQAKELGNSVGINHTTGTTGAGGMWQRPSASRHIAQEDVSRSPKFGHCPLPHVVSKSQADACYPVAHSYYWNNSWGPVDVRFSPDPKVESQWQSSSGSNREYRSKLGGLDDGLNSRFSKPTGLQALAADSSFTLKANAGPMGSVSDYSSAAELELEWQFIVDPKSKAGLDTPISDGRICEEDEDVAFKEVIGNSSEQDEPESIQVVNSGDIGSSEIVTKSNKHYKGLMTKGTKEIMTKINNEIMTKTSKEIETKINEEIMTKSSKEVMSSFECHQVSEDKQHRSKSKQGVVYQGSTEHHALDSSSSIKTSLLWRTTDKDGSNLLGAELEENRELPTSPAKSPSRIPLSTFDILEKDVDRIRSLDKNLLTALLHGNEPTRLENVGLPSSAILPGRSDAAPAPVHFQTVSQPRSIPSIMTRPPMRLGSLSLSADNRNTSWNGGGSASVTADKDSGLLGEALCHSQTRAREAEKKVQQAYEQQERLVRLFFREASQSLTYQHWVTSLQIENMWLRKFAPNESLAWLHRSFVDPFSTMGRMSSRSWKALDKDYARRRMEHNLSAMHEKDTVDLGESHSNDIVMGCTLGIAFALGLSLAGAGLMIGWSMGWILLAYSVSV